MIEDRWTELPAASEVDLLVHRSRLLGADRAVTNYAGGNTSCKTDEPDPVTGELVRVLWVKGSGGDLGTLTREGLAAIAMPRFDALANRYRGPAHEDEMPGLLLHCVFANVPAPPSIDTPLHAFVPYRHADHLHPDSVIALACAADGAALVKDVFGGEVLWLDYRRPGWELGLQVGRLAREHPGARGVVLGGHGVMTWADTARDCYAASIDVIRRAAAFLAEHGRAEPFGPRVGRRALSASRIAPSVRGAVALERRAIARFWDDADVLELLASAQASRLAAMGTSCPDHFLRTRLRPLYVDDPATIGEAAAAYRERYREYYETHRQDASPDMRGSDPAIVLVPGAGMWSFGPDGAAARIAGEYYRNAIAVMRGAEAVSRYAPIDDAERFRVEYWSLEEAKLRRMPRRRPLHGRVALVAGGASGIGRAVVHRLAAEGATIVVADIDVDGARALADDLGGPDHATATGVDLRDESSVRAMVDAACLAYGGVDILVQSAGLALSRPLLDTAAEDWDLQHGVMARGSFLACREAARVMVEQRAGGDIVLVASKNAVFAGPANVAYGAAKAAQAHLVRLLAADLGEHGIRVNGVNPDAVVRGSGIFERGWGAERAAAYGIDPADLGRFYAERTLLKREILPEDVASAVFVLVGPDLPKTTGMIVPVDGGVPGAFLR